MNPTCFKYQPFYCEENIWWLSLEPHFEQGPSFVVFVAGLEKHCPFFAQRAAGAGEAVFWDYHAILLDSRMQVWDLDARLPMPCRLDDYLRGSFPLAGQLPSGWEPLFRIQESAAFRADFASDRSHMRVGSRWRMPVPPWPAIGRGMNLPDYVDMRRPEPGIVLDLNGLRAFTKNDRLPPELAKPPTAEESQTWPRAVIGDKL